MVDQRRQGQVSLEAQCIAGHSASDEQRKRREAPRRATAAGFAASPARRCVHGGFVFRAVAQFRAHFGFAFGEVRPP
ncbi:hypothetical protein EKH55_0080 [Sinorhizobium alkalisoli]|nr:hypothetical protein EKH55_0080 [Sinorhizobium alkalisoli]